MGIFSCGARKIHVVEARGDREGGGGAPDAPHAGGRGGEEGVAAAEWKQEKFSEIFDTRDAALQDRRAAAARKPQVALGAGVILPGQDAAIDGERGVRRHRVDLGAFAAGEDSADIGGRVHDDAIRRDEFRAGEPALVTFEGEREGGHLLESVDARLGLGAVGGPAMHRHFEPDDAIMAAADMRPFAAFHHDGMVGPEAARAPHEPARAEQQVGLLVGGEGNLEVQARALRRSRARRWSARSRLAIEPLMSAVPRP